MLSPETTAAVRNCAAAGVRVPKVDQPRRRGRPARVGAGRFYGPKGEDPPLPSLPQQTRMTLRARAALTPNPLPLPRRLDRLNPAGGGPLCGQLGVDVELLAPATVLVAVEHGPAVEHAQPRLRRPTDGTVRHLPRAGLRT